MMTMKKYGLMLCVALVCAACSDETKQELGLKNTAPDEFAVVTRAPLSVPPEYTLRPPRPGEARPMEISTTDTARQTVFGEKDSTQVSAKSGDSNPLLAKTGADQADPNIRSVVDSEKPEDSRTTAERLLFMKGDKDKGTPIDPSEEYTRLKQEGVVAVEKRNEEIPAP